MASIDPALAGVLLWTGLALVAGLLLRRSPATLLLWAGAGWGFYLLGRNPYAGVTVLLLAAMWIVHRWGLRHLLLYGGLAFVFATVTWVNLASGMLLPAAVGNAVGRTVRFVAFTAAAYVLWRIVTARLGYLTNPLAWAAETRRVQQTAEHKRAMGLGRRGLGALGKRTRTAITGRTPPALPRPPDDIDSLSQRDLLIHARRAGIERLGQHTIAEVRDLVRAARTRPGPPPTATHPPLEPEPATARHPTAPVPDTDDFGIPEPLFRDREPVWRWQR